MSAHMFDDDDFFKSDTEVDPADGDGDETDAAKGKSNTKEKVEPKAKTKTTTHPPVQSNKTCLIYIYMSRSLPLL